ncbi:MAG TPA: hypothetical protein VHS06_07695, partial [Chloroflexota bacterium]|nr:hypothetical protein [Chloroflexota bacterium]
STSRSDSWIKPFILIDGKPVDRELNEVLMEFDGGDVYIKGANAVDAEGNAGVLVASKVGGNIGTAMGMVLARGAHVIIPVGLEKLVPSVIDASRKCGIKKLKYPAGATLGLIPVVSGTVITEIEALRILTGVHATHVASGGIGGSEGTVVLVVEGPDDRVRAAFKIWEQIKGEPPRPCVSHHRSLRHGRQIAGVTLPSATLPQGDACVAPTGNKTAPVDRSTGAVGSSLGVGGVPDPDGLSRHRPYK